MRIIFVKDHIVDDDLCLMVRAGRKGTLTNDTTGQVELDVLNDDEEGDILNEFGEVQMYGVIYCGTISGVQPSFYISLRKDL